MRLRGNKLMRAVDFWAGIPFIRLLSLSPHSRRVPEDIQDIGLVSLAAVGDMMLSVCPAIPALRKKFPTARIHLYVTSANKNILPLLAPADSVTLLPLSRPWQATQIMRARHCDILIDFNPWPRISALLCALSGAGFTIGFKTKGQGRHYAFDAPVAHSNAQHELMNNADLLRPIGIETLPQPDIRPQVKDLPLPAALETGKPYVIFHPWASGVRHEMRQWPAGHWRALAQRVAAVGLQIVLTGGPADRDATEQLVRAFDLTGDQVLNSCGMFSLQQTAAAICHAKAMVSVNTGPMHIAAAIGTPLIALNGPTNPARWGALSAQAISLQPEKGDFAYLNLGFEYPKHVAPCMQHISAGTVWSKLQTIFRRSVTQPARAAE